MHFWVKFFQKKVFRASCYRLFRLRSRSSSSLLRRCGGLKGYNPGSGAIENESFLRSCIFLKQCTWVKMTQYSLFPVNYLFTYGSGFFINIDYRPAVGLGKARNRYFKKRIKIIFIRLVNMPVQHQFYIIFCIKS